MTEITRRNLEDAALAAGMEILKWQDVTPIVHCGESAGWWEPVLDDEDAFQLIVAIRGSIEVRKHDSWAAVADYDGDRPGALMEVEHDGTPCGAARAAREAIVLCAAEVGRRMREANHGTA